MGWGPVVYGVCVGVRLLKDVIGSHNVTQTAAAKKLDKAQPQLQPRSASNVDADDCVTPMMIFSITALSLV